MSKENQDTSDLKSDRVKDYSKYFDFSDAKLLSQEDGKTTYRIKGRNIQINSAPSYKDEKQRGKADIKVHYDFTIPEDMKSFGKGKHYLITTYGCQMNEHDTEVMRGLFEGMGYVATEDRQEADVILLILARFARVQKTRCSVNWAI